MRNFIHAYFTAWPGSCAPLHRRLVPVPLTRQLWLPASLRLAGMGHTGLLISALSAPSFQDNNGVIGLLEPMKKSMVPVQVQLSVPVVKVASGECGVPCSGQELENLVLVLAQPWALQTSPAPCLPLVLRKRPLGDAHN